MLKAGWYKPIAQIKFKIAQIKFTLRYATMEYAIIGGYIVFVPVQRTGINAYWEKV